MKYFGTDGIRGLAYEFITESLAYSVGKSLRLLDTDKVIVSRDTRESGHMIVKAIKKGCLDAGLDVLDIDIQATPVLAYMTVKEQCMGIMVTASHNPYQDNGIKVFDKGFKSTPNQETVIEQVIDGAIRVPETSRGHELEYQNPLMEYTHLYDDFLGKSNLKIALDLANGAGIKNAKHIFRQISNDLEFIGDNPNGTNINLGVGSTHMNTVIDFVKQNKFDIGFAFDGDGDRVLTCDNEGKIIDGDLMIYIFACYLKEKGKLNNDIVVLTKMSNMGIVEALKKQGINTVLTDIGDKYVIQAMSSYDAVIGGENSGHVINKELFISGDGVLNAAYLVHILEEKQCRVQDLIQDIVIYPDRLHNIKTEHKDLVNHPEIVSLVEAIQYELKDHGKVLVRASGTEPLIRISASAKTEDKVDEIINRIRSALEQLLKGMEK
ncbi:MAG: phosphoglucosamine mutase [Bacilli bacterium]|nr:phosphoglucosamine mutase [Bacilli bacterium]MBN2877376.1 phosphoglucosamine mutase [Bacilli bacterium]